MHKELSKSEHEVIKKLGEGLMVRPTGRIAWALRRLQAKGLVKYANGYELTDQGREIYIWLKKGVENATAI